MPGHGIRILILTAVWLPFTAIAQIGIGRGGPTTVFGTLTVKASEGTQLPPFFIVLYKQDKTPLQRQSVANHGSYRFEKVPNGEYNIVIEAEGVDLLSIPKTLNTTVPNYDMRFDIDLEWRDKSTRSSARGGGMAANDVYARNAGNASLMTQALAANGKKNYAEAAELLKTIVESDPKDYEAWTELGTTLFAQGNRSEAEKALKRALDASPSYPPAMLNLGKLNFEQKSYEYAIEVLGKLVAAHPESADGRRFLGESYLRIKKGSLAVSQLEEAARLDPANHAEAHLSLAALYDGAGYKDRAAAEYAKFLAIKPNYPDKQKLEKYIKENKK